MKKQIDIQLLATLGGGLIFNYLFWMEDQALNLLLYSLFITAIILIDKEILKTRKVLLAGSAHLLAAVLVVSNASDLSVITWYLSLGILVGFVHFQALRSIFTALGAAILQFITTPVNIARKLLGTQFDRLSLKPFLNPLKYIVIPFFVLVVFSVLYSNANPVFAKYQQILTGNIELALSNIFNFLFSDLSFPRFMHLILGIAVTGSILIGFRDKALELAELSCKEKMQRKKRNGKSFNVAHEIVAVFAGKLMSRKMALKTENTIGILCFILLNLLLLFLNLIDITTLWQGIAAVPAGKNFSAELHDGTNALIISIIMAMLVIVYFFNGNLNFYSRNRTLRVLAYVWIFQNSFLVLSVLLRDYQYIIAHGLTYKRIGVLIFLLLCTIGLATVYIKVAKQKTIFYLLKVNTFIWYILLLAFDFINWDVLIVKHNISNRNEITLDINHLKSLSDKTLPLLWENREILKATDSTFEKTIQNRIDWFKKHQSGTSWLSWNYPDWQTQQYLIKHHL
jgi:hypothetical protein